MSMEPLEVSLLREYLRIPSVHPDVDYGPCITFLKKAAEDAGLPSKVIWLFPDKPVLLVTLEGTHPDLPSILLNSHMDVVPVYPEKWKRDPFAAEKDSDGNIYARGSQDMKSVGIQHLEAVKRLKHKGVPLKRNVHISFVPDEEIGGEKGMKTLVTREEFKRLNVGIALDEGGPCPFDMALLFDSEKASYEVVIHCPGTPGHGSLMLPNTAGEKVRKVIDAFMERREELMSKVNNPLDQGRILSINMTQLKGGVQNNVVPPEFIVVFDCRLSPDDDHDEFVSWVESVCKEAGEGVYPEFPQRTKKTPKTKLDDTNIFWPPMKAALDEMGYDFYVMTAPGGTDARYLREVGVHGVGFSPLPNTPILLHEHNEHINEATFMKGIDVFERVVASLANA